MKSFLWGLRSTGHKRTVRANTDFNLFCGLFLPPPGGFFGSKPVMSDSCRQMPPIWRHHFAASLRIFSNIPNGLDSFASFGSKNRF
jgi:hypothetical protein